MAIQMNQINPDDAKKSIEILECQYHRYSRVEVNQYDILIYTVIFYETIILLEKNRDEKG